MVEQSLMDPNLSCFHYYQPLYNLSNQSSIGYEALLRHNTFNPEKLFKMARRSNQLYELDTYSIYHANSLFSLANQEQLNNGLLFINVFPSTLINPLLLGFIEKVVTEVSISPREIVLEINE